MTTFRSAPASESGWRVLASIPGWLSTSLRHRMAFFTVTAIAEVPPSCARLTVVHPRTTCNSGVAAALRNGQLGTLSRKAPLRTERFGSTIARKSTVLRWFLRPSLLRLLYPLIEPALLPLHCARFRPAGDRRKDFEGT